MSKEILGDACAYIAPLRRNDKARYLKIGLALRDGDRISLKIDTLPLPESGWEGWINVFPRRENLGQTHASESRPIINSCNDSAKASTFDDLADDIPF